VQETDREFYFIVRFTIKASRSVRCFKKPTIGKHLLLGLLRLKAVQKTPTFQASEFFVLLLLATLTAGERNAELEEWFKLLLGLPVWYCCYF